ncbi:MAG: hypothetical protein JXA71_11585, partial [Chitinispirillaceae bacterium]|nr:hypothetical protein [Chitinispirillaceae bacterium]
MKKTRLTSQEIKLFRSAVYTHFKKHRRPLPWRTDYRSYHILVSEIMLQQTQVDRVALKFPPFIASFPDFEALARAPFPKVLALWQGLGYNRRALHLKRCAEMVVHRCHGTLPSSPEILSTFPGIGTATAASICAFAFNKPVVFLETNIRTVLIHHFFPDRSRVSDGELWPIAEAALDQKNPRRWYSALMDYGSMLKKQYGNASRR